MSRAPAVAGESVSLVIPGRNCAATLDACLRAAVAILKQADSPLVEIIYVDDGSTDASAAIAGHYPVKIVRGTGRGPGAARNLGMRAAGALLVWFIDSDCVAEPDALTRLMPHLADPRVAAVGGSYGSMTDHSLLACLIHEEIIERHRHMPTRVNFLATFNVIYRRRQLEEIGGFDERFLKAQDAELAFRLHAAGHEMRFEFHSRVRHYHPTRLRTYLKTQRDQGYWRVWLHAAHRGHAFRNSYSNVIDHVQPPLALASLPALLLGLLPYPWSIGAGFPILLLAIAQIPMTIRLLRATGQIRFLAFAPMSLIRSYARAFGMALGVWFLFQSRRTSIELKSKSASDPNASSANEK